MCASPTRRGAERPRPRVARAQRGDGSSASPARSARPGPRRRSTRRSTGRAGPGAPLGQELQQPYRRAAVASRGCRARRRFGVFEMGMNHAGELAALTRLVRPHVAIVTAIAPAHREFFASEAEIADAKAEIFEGLEPGGTAIIPYRQPAPRPARRRGQPPCRRESSPSASARAPTCAPPMSCAARAAARW